MDLSNKEVKEKYNYKLDFQKKVFNDYLKEGGTQEAYKKAYNRLNFFFLKERGKGKRIYGASKLINLFPVFIKFPIRKIVGANKKILEIGCGDGFLSISLAKKNEVTAIDVSKVCIEVARKNAKKYKRNIKFDVKDCRKLDFDSNSFDVIISTDVFEHLPPKDIDAHLKNVKRMLKKKGLLIIVTPSKYIKHNLAPFHFREYDYEELENILKNMGFKLSSIFLSRFFPFNFKTSIKIKKKIEDLFKKYNLPYFIWELFGLAEIIILAEKELK